MVLGFDKYGNALGVIDFIELQWNRKYLECGSFVIYLAASDYDTDIKYVQYSDRPETGIVQKIEYEEKVGGRFVTLSGFFVDKVLDGGACHFAFNFEGGVSPVQMIKEYMQAALNLDSSGNINTGVTDTGKRVISKLTIAGESEYPASADNTVEAGEPLGQALYGVMSGDDRSYTCEPVFYKDETRPLLGLNIRFWKGQDLRDSVRFSDSLNNISSIKYTYDESGEYARYQILQELPEDADAIQWQGDYGVVTSTIVDGKLKYYLQAYYENEANRPKDMGMSMPEKVYYSQIDGVELLPANEHEIVLKMQEAARLDMLNNYKVESIEVDALQHRFIYRQDYDLGDVCTVSIDDIRQMYTARIIEIDEVYASNKLDVTVIMGTPQKQKWRAM